MLRALCDSSGISALQAFVRNLSDPLRFSILAKFGEVRDGLFGPPAADGNAESSRPDIRSNDGYEQVSQTFSTHQDSALPEAAMSTVLVTGGSGFIGSHSILQLLAAGHNVRTTVRSLKREADVRAMLKEGAADPDNRLTFCAADLLNDAGWREAVSGCEYVLHVKSSRSLLKPRWRTDQIRHLSDVTQGWVRRGYARIRTGL
jgi:NAD-dependent epimerase/dehydratase family protein